MLHNHTHEHDEHCPCCSGKKSTIIDPDNMFLLDLDPDDLLSEEDLGLGKGDPAEHINIKSGDTAVDFACIEGNDVFIARRYVGRLGKVIGVDINPESVDKAKNNSKRLSYSNIEFLCENASNTSIKSNSADFVLINKFLNIIKDKSSIVKEAFRILKPIGAAYIQDVFSANEAINENGIYFENIYRFKETLNKLGFAKVEIVEERNFDFDSFNLLNNFSEEFKKCCDTNNYKIKYYYLIAWK
jgi:ubiquinone/menaquinone biosynthesis C-methylase UbiE